MAAPGDCNDSRNDLWSAPGEVPSLNVTSTIALSWSPPASPGGNVVLYDLLRSTSAGNLVTSAVCVLTNGTVTRNDFTVPTAGNVIYYLVRAENECPGGQGPLGNASNWNAPACPILSLSSTGAPPPS